MHFLGLTEARTARRIVAREPARLHFAAADGLATICATPLPKRLWRGRAHPFDISLDVQRLIAMAATEGPFVAAAPGSEAPGSVEALAALGNLALYADILARFGLRREHRIAIDWDARATVRAFAERDAPELTLARALGGDLFGQAIAWAMETERRRLGDWALAQLQDAVEDLLTLPTRDGDQILNAVAMIGPGGQAAFDTARARIAAALSGQSRICCVGPLPALSFAVIDLRRADAVASIRRASAMA